MWVHIKYLRGCSFATCLLLLLYDMVNSIAYTARRKNILMQEQVFIIFSCVFVRHQNPNNVVYDVYNVYRNEDCR